jgi:hypothetical protein
MIAVYRVALLLQIDQHAPAPGRTDAGCTARRSGTSAVGPTCLRPRPPTHQRPRSVLPPTRHIAGVRQRFVTHDPHAPSVTGSARTFFSVRPVQSVEPFETGLLVSLGFEQRPGVLQDILLPLPELDRMETPCTCPISLAVLTPRIASRPTIDLKDAVYVLRFAAHMLTPDY